MLDQRSNSLTEWKLWIKRFWKTNNVLKQCCPTFVAWRTVGQSNRIEKCTTSGHKLVRGEGEQNSEESWKWMKESKSKRVGSRSLGTLSIGAFAVLSAVLSVIPAATTHAVCGWEASLFHFGYIWFFYWSPGGNFYWWGPAIPLSVVIPQPRKVLLSNEWDWLAGWLVLIFILFCLCLDFVWLLWGLVFLFFLVFFSFLFSFLILFLFLLLVSCFISSRIFLLKFLK